MERENAQHLVRHSRSRLREARYGGRRKVGDGGSLGVGGVFRHGRWRVSAAQAQHVEPWLQSLAYRVDTERGSIVFAGDTGPCAPINDLARGADIFVANCWNHQKTMEEDGEAPGQTGTLDAARFARDSGAAVLILTHTGPGLSRPGSREKAIRDIAAVYKGEIIFGEEGMVLDPWTLKSQVLSI